MYQLKNFAQWQRTLRSSLYILLIVSMLWIPYPTDVSASRSSVEEDSVLTCEYGRRVTRCHDESSDIRLIIPKQKGARQIEVITELLDIDAIANNSDDEFSLNRAVLGLYIINRQTGEMLTEFDPEITISMPYNRTDVEAAGGLDRLTLVYYDNENMPPLSDVNIEGDENGGVIYGRSDGFESRLPKSSECPPGTVRRLVSDHELKRYVWRCVRFGKGHFMGHITMYKLDESTLTDDQP